MAGNALSCASCGTANEDDARFCDGCGGSLARVCGACGVEARTTARFCKGCGASFDATAGSAAVASAGPVRRTVTVMFADLAGSTSFEERVDAETAREVVGRYHDLLRATAQHHRAGVTKYIGDGFMAVWGVPETGLGDAGHAVDAAVELQDRFVDLAARVTAAHGVELALRVAVNTGEVVVGEGDADLVGDAINVAARLEGECPRGHVVVGEETWRSTRGQHRYDALGQVQVKGRTTPVAVFQWLGRHAETADVAPLVGRADEVRRLQGALEDATAARAARMVTVIGDPGVGKTRLAAEFVTTHPDLRVIRTRCNVEETVALAPIVELLRSRDLDADVPVSTPERDRVLRDLNGLAAGIPGSVEETFWALRKFVEVLAIDGPLVIVLDDLQWADTLLLDFVEHLLEWVAEAPILVVALARPELREVRADFVSVSRWVTQAVHLGGLDSAATAELAAAVLGGARLPEELLHRLPSSTGGNPLFVRELIGMLVDDEVLVPEPSGWRLTIDVDAITIPPTIHALLASRLERLDAADRRVLEIASVLGTDFSLGAVSVLAGRGASAIKPSLERLRRLQLAQPSGAYVGDEPVWRFHHVLIRDVAYRRLLKSDRADLHERFADWVEAGGATLASDPDEMIARHLESAHGYRLDLGTLDDRAGGLALRSARCYLASARRALDRDELASAGSQAARGAALATAEEGLRAELLLIGCEAFLSAGDVTTCAPLVDDFDRIATGPLAPWATCYRCQFVVYTDPQRLPEVDALLQDAIDEFGRRNDAAGLAKAYRVRAGARARLGRIGDAEADLLEALIPARKSGDQRQITAALSAAPSAALWGPSPVPKAGGRCLDVVRMQRMATAAPSLEATSLRCLAVLELLRGRPDKARSMLSDARQIVADLGLRHGLMETELFAGIIESMVGDPVAAEPHFRAALKGLGALGVGADAGLAAALLARSVLAQGRVDDADSYATESERLAGRNLKTAVAWRAVRAEIHCAQGRYDDAIVLARDAVAVAAGTDLVLDNADACLALSRVLAASGDTQGGDAARRDAEALYAAKQVVGTIGQTTAPAAPPPSAPPPAVTSTASSRLARTNRASEASQHVLAAMAARDVDTVVACFSDGWAFDDRRGLNGDSLTGRAALRTAVERIWLQYNHFEGSTMAVRGELLQLGWSRWSDDTGNETAYLHVYELDDDGLIAHEVRFDDDDFEGAYRELDQRYYAGEGLAFAKDGWVSTEYVLALNQNEFDRVFGELTAPEFRRENRSRSLLGARSAAEFRTSSEELSEMVVAARGWLSAICWLSPTCAVNLFEREAVGLDDEKFSWTWVLVCEVHDGRVTSMCDFDPDDEDAAFAYAEERVRATTSRLAVTNRASETFERVGRAMAARDVDAVVGYYSSDRFVFDDRRAWSGDPVEGIAAWRAAAERILAQYSHFEVRTLAVRGATLQLAWSRWSDDSGNETTHLDVHEIGDDGRIGHDVRFDEDDFDGAFRELDRRYYAGEGAAFAEGGALATEFMAAYGRGDFDRMFGELANPEFRLENRSRSVFGNRSAAQVRASNEELSEMVTSARSWLSAICWLSPTCCAFYFEREAVGLDGGRYSWTRLNVAEIRGERLVSMCQFDLDDEEQAFAYAEERVRATASRLAVVNRASEALDSVARAMAAHDVDAVVGYYSDGHVYVDRRGLSGGPVEGAAARRAAIERVFEQYAHFEGRTLAVRGERLVLGRSRWSDDDGNESIQLHVFEVDEDGLIGYAARFDEDDFEGAYRELNRRYYAGEGAAFAEGGAIGTEVVIATNRGDLDRVYGDLTTPGVQFENRSRSVFPDRSIDEYRASIEELDAMVTATRVWHSAMCWLSPTCCVFRAEREAVGLDGEQYAWTWVYAGEIRDGRLKSLCQFDFDDEAAAFAYAEERMRATTSRLAVTNRASETWNRVAGRMEAHDVDAVIAHYSDGYVYDDHRGLSGDPLQGAAALRAAVERVLEQYPHIAGRTLAVRGERLLLIRPRWSDDDGNETVQLQLYELDDDGLIVYEGRFDEDDFEGAYRQLDRRYYAGEGAAFSQGGSVPTEWMIALNRGDFDTVFGELCTPEFRLESQSGTVFGDRSAAEMRASFEELAAMVASVQGWLSAICWLSPTMSVSIFEREAVGLDREQYAWTRLTVNEIRDGRVTLMCDFNPDDEEAAFAYAEERVRATTSRLAVTNRASETWHRLSAAMAAHDVDAVVALYPDGFDYDDRRGWSGDPIGDGAAWRAGVERFLAQYSHHEGRMLAVRGARLALARNASSDDAGNETAQLNVIELAADGRIGYHGRFEGDDFEGAYRELDRRYYAGEGAAFAQGGVVASAWMMALTRSDFDTAYDEITTPDFQVVSRSGSLFGARSAAEHRASLKELDAMVASTRTWLSAICWLSSTVFAVRFERDALGPDAEEYSWSRLGVVELRDGKLASMCGFDDDAEDVTFAYAEERVRATASRLPLANRASEAWDGVVRAMAAHDVDAAAGYYSDAQVYDDHRGFSGGPVEGTAAVRAATKRLLDQYSHFEGRTLAVRGERLQLAWSRSSDDSGNEMTQLHVHEADDDGRIVYQGRFDADDFEGAYRELDQRYYAGEGAEFAAGGEVQLDYAIALNRGDLDRVFGELSAPDFRSTNRSRSVFGDRSAAEVRAGLEELAAMVSSARTWFSAVRWLSPTCAVVRQEREAVGLDGEDYSWTRLYTCEVRDGRVASNCQFDADAEEAAFAYAEELLAARPSRLAIANRATEGQRRLHDLIGRPEFDSALSLLLHEQFRVVDRRAWPSAPVVGREAGIIGMHRLLADYPHVDMVPLAVRGQHLALDEWRCRTSSGFEATYLNVREVNHDGQIMEQVRFDGDDFESAYSELDRRYFAGEGAAFAESVGVLDEWRIAMSGSGGDLDRVFDELCAPGFRVTNRSRSVFGDRSAAELRASIEELGAMVSSTRMWAAASCLLSPNVSVARMERTAVGLNGEEFQWTHLTVSEVRAGRLTSICQFEPEDEDEAFAYAESLVAARPSRLPVANLATEVEAQVFELRGRPEFDSALSDSLHEEFQVIDRRAWPSAPCLGREAGVAGIRRLLADYPYVDIVPLAVRGQHLSLVEWRCRNPSGFEATYLNVCAFGEDGRLWEQVRFDGDNFEGAYRELERRYYAGEGGAFAENGAVTTEWIIALNQGDLDRIFAEIVASDFRIASRSRSAFGDRSAAEVRASLEELATMVASAQTWNSVVCWLSPQCCVSRMEREAVGLGGERFTWTRLYVVEALQGRLTSLCEFEIENEDEAFAYAEELGSAQPSRLAINNLAIDAERRVIELLGRPEFDSALVDVMHEDFRMIDRRAMRSEDFVAREAALDGFHRAFVDYSDVDIVPLAVRGQHLSLVEWRCRSLGGYEATYLNVNEVDDSGQIMEQVRFDDGDFESASRELEQRYYAGEGAAFAAGGALWTDYVPALNRGDFDGAFGEFFAPDFRMTSRSRSVFGDRSAAEYRASQKELAAMVASARGWISAVRWQSQTICVMRTERKAVGLDGEAYAWTWLFTCEVRGGRMASSCKFELENEQEAFAYAEELEAARPSRLAVANPVTDAERGWFELVARDDFESALSPLMYEQFHIDDRRAMPAAPCIGRAAAITAFRRLVADYPDVDVVPLAVRGERLALVEWHCRTPSGFEATYLNVHEFDEFGQYVEQVRFDGDDFESAYRELERRYYAGEGAAFAAGGAVWTDYVIGVNRGDLEMVFTDVVASDFLLTSRARSAFGDRPAAEYRAGIEELDAMVASARTWFSAVHWLSPTISVIRFEREAVGSDGEAYGWTRLFTSKIRGGFIASACEFELEDEQAAFTYAEELAAKRC